MGEFLAKLAEAGNIGDIEGILDLCCLTCAFRRGTLPNISAGTGMVAFNCAIGIDKDDFACHHGMKDGEPQKLCAGYIAAKNAPFDAVKAETFRLLESLDNIGDGDGVRGAFDAWAARVDPDYKMDVYELGRRWAKATAQPLPHDLTGASAR